MILLVRPEFWDDLICAAADRYPGRPDADARFRAEIIEHVDRLSDFPSFRKEVAEGIRRELVRRYGYWILFSVEADHVLVLGLVFAGRDLDTWLKRRFPNS